MALASFDSLVANMMRLFGTVATIITEDISQAAYDPNTSQLVGYTVGQYPVNAIFLDYTLQRNGLSDSQGTLIQAGDKQCFIQPINKANSLLTMPIIQPNKDRIQVAGKTYKILSLKKVDPTMNNAVLFELHLKE